MNFPNNRLSPYVEFQEHSSAFYAIENYVLSLDNVFIDSLQPSLDKEVIYVNDLNGSHLMPTSVLSQILVWKIELAA